MELTLPGSVVREEATSVSGLVAAESTARLVVTVLTAPGSWVRVLAMSVSGLTFASRLDNVPDRERRLSLAASRDCGRRGVGVGCGVGDAALA